MHDKQWRNKALRDAVQPNRWDFAGNGVFYAAYHWLLCHAAVEELKQNMFFVEAVPRLYHDDQRHKETSGSDP